MSAFQIALIFRWLVPLWLLGWCVFPLSRRLFLYLPDHGLAAGRLLLLLTATVGGYWLATLHLLPFGVASLLVVLGALVTVVGWKSGGSRQIVQTNWRALLVSDAIFLLSFGFFLWVRLRHPDINEFEKPMDAMLLSSAARAHFLPFTNAWLSGEAFTNYYYFGPLFGGNLARLFVTPTWFAYNLIQPLVCALFLSILWSLGAALTHSKRLGLLVMLLVGLAGHLEPLRQLHAGTALGAIDWWKTSRVVDNTINEYPAFTLLLGDMHAHFYALSFAILHFTVCFGVIRSDRRRLRCAHIVLGGTLCGIFAIANTWDTPLYGLLWLGCLFLLKNNNEFETLELKSALAGFGLSALIALPYFLRFHSQVSGVVFELWHADAGSFLLFWGTWIALGVAAFGWKSQLLPDSAEGQFSRVLLGAGLLALFAPSLFYLRGAFGDGDFRHMDTVFKFWLQAWLLGGLAVSSELLYRLSTSRYKTALFAAGVPLLGVLALAPYAVVHSRVVDYGSPDLSLNAMKFLPQADQQAIEWLNNNAQPNDVVLEAVKWKDNGIASEWDPNYGRVSALTGVPTLIGWNGHVNAWGGDAGEIQRRGQEVFDFYHHPDPTTAVLKARQVRWIFDGASEQTLAPPLALPLPRQNFGGSDGSQAAIFTVPAG